MSTFQECDLGELCLFNHAAIPAGRTRPPGRLRSDGAAHLRRAIFSCCARWSRLFGDRTNALPNRESFTVHESDAEPHGDVCSDLEPDANVLSDTDYIVAPVYRYRCGPGQHRGRACHCHAALGSSWGGRGWRRGTLGFPFPRRCRKSTRIFRRIPLSQGFYVSDYSANVIRRYRSNGTIVTVAGQFKYASGESPGCL